MSQDWQKNLEVLLQQKAAQEQAQQREKARKERTRIEEARKRRKKVEHKRGLRKYKQTFKCQVKECTVVSEPIQLHWNNDIGDYSYDLRTAVGLERCNHCGKWACRKNKHYHDKSGYCKDCADFFIRTGGNLPQTKEQKITTAKNIFKAVAAIVVVGAIVGFVYALIFIPNFLLIVIVVIISILIALAIGT